MTDWSELFLAQGALRAQLERELEAHRWAEALGTAIESLKAAQELANWIEAKMDAEPQEESP